MFVPFLAKGAHLSSPGSAQRGRNFSAAKPRGTGGAGPPRPRLAGLGLGLGRVALRHEGAQASLPFLGQTSLTQPVFDTHSGRIGEWGWETGSDQEPITPHRSLQGWFFLSVCARARASAGNFCDRSSQILE